MSFHKRFGAIAARPSALAAFVAAGSLAPLALADPPTDPPPCDVQLGAVFCIRMTDQVQVEGDDDRFRFMFEVLNWTGTDAEGLNVALNVGGVVIDSPPSITDAFIDPNGRVIGPLQIPPAGNLAITNDWSVINQTATAVQYGIPFLGMGTPIDHPSAFGFDGLLDPDFAMSSQGVCIEALLAMIPGSVVSFNSTPPTIFTPDLETIDDGTNVRDGFVIEIDDIDPGEAFSLNWHLLDGAGNAIGIVSLGGGVMGDQYGFGAFNLARIPGTEGQANQAPAPLFNLNTGFNPSDDSDANADSPVFWAEDEFRGLDEFPINPIPPGRPGQGTFFAVEPGAAVTASFMNEGDNAFLFNGQKVRSGSNIVPGQGPCNPADNAEPFGVLDLQDIAGFVTAFLQQDLTVADLNGDTVFDLRDISLFVKFFVGGCP